MSSLTRFAAGASALALASGALLSGAAAAGAQGSSEIAADLATAAEALNGPVAVAGRGDAGTKVTYTNTSEVSEMCAGFTLPYSTIAENDDIDPSTAGGDDLLASLALVQAIEAGGGISLLSANEDGTPNAYADPNPAPADNNDIVGMIAPAIFGQFGNFVEIAAGESATWDAPTPDTPAAAALICFPQVEGGEMGISFGIDRQVVADQINDQLGPLGSVGAGSVSGGSVEMGANLLGSSGGGGEAEATGGSAGGSAGSQAEVEVEVDAEAGEAPAAAVG